ncbi:MAG TPA: riboflavin kinase [Candidatus Paceibacterota bacterium]
MQVKGIVIEGDKVGKKLGFPTANIKMEKAVEPGIYAGFTTFDGERRLSALYIGKMRPVILETHIIDFSGDLYGKMITVEIMEKVREEIGGLNISEGGLSEKTLRNAIKDDIEKIKIMKKYSKKSILQ